MDPILEQYTALENKVLAYTPNLDKARLFDAFTYADNAHASQQRKDGSPYITHPLAVADLVADLELDPDSVIAALLHDTIEDTGATHEDVAKRFGEPVAELVEGVTKLTRVQYASREEKQMENLRKMLLAMSKDIRVILIKICDRLHNMRTMQYQSPKKQREKALETMEIYAPLAHRLGMNMVKWELEELSFKTLYPEIYEEIDRLVAERAPQREEYLRDVIDQIEEDLRRSGTKGTVSGRPKSHYSIYQKMIVRGKAFDEVFDLVAVRVLVDSIKDCYGVLGALHGRWNPIPGRFKDYIAMPKFNLYQSLHTTVIGPGGKPVEIQIRTFDMHERAEHGVAAHWKYKQNPNASSGDSDRMSSEEQANWLRALVEMERETGDPEEFLDSLRYEIAGDEVYVFTPKG